MCITYTKSDNNTWTNMDRYKIFTVCHFPLRCQRKNTKNKIEKEKKEILLFDTMTETNGFPKWTSRSCHQDTEKSQTIFVEKITSKINLSKQPDSVTGKQISSNLHMDYFFFQIFDQNFEQQNKFKGNTYTHIHISHKLKD